MMNDVLGVSRHSFAWWALVSFFGEYPGYDLHLIDITSSSLILHTLIFKLHCSTLSFSSKTLTHLTRLTSLT